ncbi:centromere protein I [Ambystoma mexicanum]|uniref:centromere protein I n=1 Tax=Ambystoma mexicanum TaxID=8296 RepID=UPI0037E8E82D
MERQKLGTNQRSLSNPERRLTGRQTDLSTWLGTGKVTGGDGEGGGTSRRMSHPDRQESALEEESEQDRLNAALAYFKGVKDRTPLRGNDILMKHLNDVEQIGLYRGLPPEGIDVLLNVAVSGMLVDSVCTRLLKCLIPASIVPENAIVKAVSWLCTCKSTATTQVLFLRWLITVFDLIEAKEQLHALYGILFCFVQDEKLSPFICHLLYLLTKKENVKPFRVRKLIDMQTKMGLLPHLQGLLALFKVFCPHLVSLSLPSKAKKYFKNADHHWKEHMSAVKHRNMGSPLTDQQLNLGGAPYQFPARKRKWNANMNLNISSRDHLIGRKDCARNEAFPVEQLHTFNQLLQNIHNLEFPSHMGSVLRSPMLLHYLNCVKDDAALLRLNYWMAQVLHDDCAWYTDKKYNEDEVNAFLDNISNAQQFLQEGFPSCEEFVYKCIPHWNGCFRAQILKFIRWIPLPSSSEMESLFYEPLGQHFFLSSVYFKCSIIETLKEMLQNWLTWHAVYAAKTSTSDSPVYDTLSGLVNAVAELIHFVGRISTIAMHMERSTLLLHFILDFYETVCDMFVKFSLPLVILPPAGVFYPALLSMESVNLNQLCYIMYRYRTNLVAAKGNKLNKKDKMSLNISSQTFQEYNQYMSAMVGCLWTSNAFQQDTHAQGIFLPPEVLERTGVLKCRNSFNIVHHPALMGHAFLFLQEGYNRHKGLSLHLIKGKLWNWYLEYLYMQGMQGLKLFIESSVNRLPSSSQSQVSSKEDHTTLTSQK